MTRLGATAIQQIKFLLCDEAETDAKGAMLRYRHNEFAVLCLTAARWSDKAIKRILDSEQYGRESVSLNQLDSLRASYVERFMREIGYLIQEAGNG